MKEQVKLPNGENKDIYELKCMNNSDIKMIRAKAYFERKPYYQTYKEKQNGQNNIDKSTEVFSNSEA